MKLVLLLGISVLACGPAWAQTSGFGGMGRLGNTIGQGQSGSSSGQQAPNTGIVPWLSVNGIYSNTLNATPNFQTPERMGGSFSGGIGGTKSWLNSELEAGYIGSGTYNDITNQATGHWRQTHGVNLGYARQLNQRWQLSISQFGGLSDGGFGAGSAFGATGIPGLGGGFGFGSLSDGAISGSGLFGSTDQNGLVDNELLYNRTKFYSGRAAVNYLVSDRLTLTGFGGGSFVRRSNSLSGLNSYTAGGGFTRQLSQTTQAGVSYSHSNIDYIGLFGGVNVDSIQGAFERQLTPRATLTIQGGASRLDSTYVGATALPPELAALLGVSSTLEVKKSTLIAAIGGVALGYDLRKGHVSTSYNRSVVPGNGFLYTSVRDLANVGYGFSVGQKVGINFIASYYRTSGKVAVLRTTQSAQGGAMLSYRLFRSVSMTGQGGYRYVSLSGLRQQREVYAGFGLSWHPGDGPFVF